METALQMKFDGDKFANDIFEKRLKQNLSLRELEKITGVKHWIIHKMEEGQQPPVDAFGKMCAWLNVSTDKYFI